MTCWRGAESVARRCSYRSARLIRLGVSYTGSGADLVEAQPRRSLSELQPDDVFRRCYERSHQAEPPAELL